MASRDPKQPVSLTRLSNTLLPCIFHIYFTSAFNSDNKTANIYVLKICRFNTVVTMTPIKRRKRQKSAYRIFTCYMSSLLCQKIMT